MKKVLFALAIASLVGAAACGETSSPDARVPGADAGPPDASPPDAGVQLATVAQIQNWMNGKTFKMDGTNIPPFPNGYNEDTNFGAASQCYVSVTMAVANNNVTVTSALGTLEGAPNLGDTGTCNHTVQAGSPLSFSSTNVLIENVQGNAQCFDFTVTYPGFAQEGRGKIDPYAGKGQMTLELYFSGQATGHKCAAGAVGAQTVMIKGAAFTGNAQQVYVVQ